MACGTPVLTSNVASLPEVVGDAALKVNPLDVEAIADGLIQLIENPGLRARLRVLGLEQARRFSWDKTAAETWKVLKEADF
jgi:glycosyltransferase involved in cell wall biosynthesis